MKKNEPILLTESVLQEYGIRLNCHFIGSNVDLKVSYSKDKTAFNVYIRGPIKTFSSEMKYLHELKDKFMEVTGKELELK